MFTLISESDIMERVKDGLNLLEGVMFIYTRAVIEKTIADLKQISKTLNMVVQFCYLAFCANCLLRGKICVQLCIVGAIFLLLQPEYSKYLVVNG